MKIDKIHYLFIGSAILFHTVALVLTWYAITFMGSHECNQIMDKSFVLNGFIGSAVITTVVIVVVMGAIPFLFGEVDKIGVASAIIEFAVVGTFTLDCFHDIFVVSNNPLAYATGWIINMMFSVFGIPSVCG